MAEPRLSESGAPIPQEKPATPGLSRLSTSRSPPPDNPTSEASRKATPTPPPGTAPGTQSNPFSRLRSLSRRPSTQPGPAGGDADELAGSNGAAERETRPQRPFIVPQLTELCVNTISASFEQRPTFGKMPDKFVKAVTKRVALDLPLEVAGQLIEDEDYWRRRTALRWRNCDVSVLGKTWKQLYMERNLEAALESYDPAVTELESLRQLVAFAAPFVQQLVIKQLPSHLDLGILFEGFLGNVLQSLSVSYGLRNVGMDYTSDLFGMKLADCRALAAALPRARALTALALANDVLDDDKVKALAAGLADNRTVTKLDLSHNKIGDRGARALAKALDEKSVLTTLNLCDNKVGAEGGKALARVLQTSPSLTSLNLRLNSLGDEGGAHIGQALAENSTLKALHLGSNFLGRGAIAAIADALQTNKALPLASLDVTCNPDIGVEGGQLLREALEQATSVKECDVRLSNMGEDTEAAIAAYVESR
ncbi:hypothetical protein KFL_000810280 [Klebsormidium nitens]|uniref:Uncharacterized protein n=1 Tax=Klebsormidium nitens TaxID=105231 RepID=A0A1Y1HY77_KLENI|nr:hypothetical protein KFL_000810280 [Klebsormidium nitens]|eukprot:GAQ81487.1 hypothetical protein KFL_000810280 [Klebsormidium nitens]